MNGGGVESQTLNTVLPWHHKPKSSHGGLTKQRKVVRNDQAQIFAQRAMSNAFNAQVMVQEQYNSLYDFLNLYSTGSRPISSQFCGKRRRQSDSNHTTNVFNKYLQAPKLIGQSRRRINTVVTTQKRQ